MRRQIGPRHWRRSPSKSAAAVWRPALADQVREPRAAWPREVLSTVAHGQRHQNVGQSRVSAQPRQEAVKSIAPRAASRTKPARIVPRGSEQNTNISLTDFRRHGTISYSGDGAGGEAPAGRSRFFPELSCLPLRPLARVLARADRCRRNQTSRVPRLHQSAPPIRLCPRPLRPEGAAFFVEATIGRKQKREKCHDPFRRQKTKTKNASAKARPPQGERWGKGSRRVQSHSRKKETGARRSPRTAQ